MTASYSSDPMATGLLDELLDFRQSDRTSSRHFTMNSATVGNKPRFNTSLSDINGGVCGMIAQTLLKPAKHISDSHEHSTKNLCILHSRRSTGYSAFQLLYGRECILPIEFSSLLWSMVDWSNFQTKEDLLVVRMQRLDERNLDEE